MIPAVRYLALLTLAALISCAPTQSSSPLIGTWSNGKDGFKTVIVALRTDGQALFGGAMGSIPARWEKTDTGLNLTIAGGGESSSLSLIYDVTNASLIVSFDGDAIVLQKISDEEPPDMLALAKAAHAEEIARREAWYHSETHQLRGISAVRSLLEDWSKAQPTTPPADTIALSTKNSPHNLSLYSLGRPNCFVSILLEKREATELSGYPLEGRPEEVDATSDLPLLYELPAPMRNKLEALGPRFGLKMETHASSQFSFFETERFYRALEFTVPPDADTLGVVEEIMATLWPNPKTKYIVKLSFRIPDPK